MRKSDRLMTPKLSLVDRSIELSQYRDYRYNYSFEIGRYNQNIVNIFMYIFSLKNSLINYISTREHQRRIEISFYFSRL